MVILTPHCRAAAVSSDSWYKNVDKLLTVMSPPQGGDAGASYRPVKIAVIDSGVLPDHTHKGRLVVKDFISIPNDCVKDDPQHGTDSIDLILRMVCTAQIYVARVFQNREAYSRTAGYMAEVAIPITPLFQY